jgi:hypothetical protein
LGLGCGGGGVGLDLGGRSDGDMGLLKPRREGRRSSGWDIVFGVLVIVMGLVMLVMALMFSGSVR